MMPLMCMEQNLKVVKRIDDHTLVGRYMHDFQSRGFEWGRAGDEVQFVQSSTMELIGNQNKIALSSVRMPIKNNRRGTRIGYYF